MKFVDLFAGIGGFHEAIKNIIPEAECVFASENDKMAAKTYEKNFNIDPTNDITQQDISKIPDHNLVMAGFPCQPFSKNGKYYNTNRRTVGKDETRDQLYTYLIKLLKVKQPEMFLFENVKGLAKMKTQDGEFYFDIIVSDLKNAGYNVYTRILDSADYGLPQQRKRIYFVGFRKDIKLSEEFNFPSVIGRKSAVQDILESNVNDKYLLENLWKNRKNVKLPGMRLEALAKEFATRNDHPTMVTRRITPLAIVKGDTPSGAPRQQDKLYSKLGISPTIATFSTPSFDSNQGWRTLTPRECARLQGFPNSFILPKLDSVAYKQIGNAVSVTVAALILKNMIAAYIARKITINNLIFP